MRTNRKRTRTHIPLLRLLLPLTCGMILAIQWPSLDASYILGALATLSFLLHFWRKLHRLRSALFMIGFACLGYGFTTLKTDRLFHSYVSQLEYDLDGAVWKLRIIEPPSEREKSLRCITEIEGVFVDREWRRAEGRLLTYFQKGAEARQLEYGDVCLVMADVYEIDGPKSPDELDFKAYMLNKQVTHRTFVRSDAWRKLRSEIGLFGWLRRLQVDSRDQIKTLSLSDSSRGILSALLLGMKDDLSDDQRTSFARAGAMHVLAVSGLHVGIIYMMISALLAPLKRLRNGERWISLIAVLLLWGFACFTGLSSSVTRAATMFSFVAVGTMLKRKPHAIHAVVASAFVMLLFDPYFLVDVGFQLSYAAVIGNLILQPMIEAWWSPRWRIMKWGRSLTSVSVAAQLSTAPLALYYFHQFPNYFLLSNFVVIPLVSVLIPLGVGTFTISLIEGVAEWVALPLDIILRVMHLAMQRVSELPYAVIEGISITRIELVLNYAFLWFVVSFLIHKHRHWLVLTLWVAIAWQVNSIVLELAELKGVFQANTFFSMLNGAALVD